MKNRGGRPPSDDPRVVRTFRLSGAVSRALNTYTGNRSAIVEAAIIAWLTERVEDREHFQHLRGGKK
jgi:hypothetical protein